MLSKLLPTLDSYTIHKLQISEIKTWVDPYFCNDIFYLLLAYIPS